MARAAGVSNQPDPKPLEQGEERSETLVFREFKGVNVQSPRQSIDNDEFAWLENAQPIGFGNMPVLAGQSAALQTIAGQTITYFTTANVSGVDYLYAFTSSGNAYQILTTAPYTVTRFNGSFVFSAGVKIAPWQNLGILIIDPNIGYFDYNVTAANTLTQISNTVYQLTITAIGINYTSQPTIGFSGGGGSGAAATCDISVGLATITAAGTGYAPGDLLTVAGGSFNTAATITVSAVNGSGGVTGITLSNAGDYTASPANPASVTGGYGTGATFTLNFGIGPIKITNKGTNYTTPPTVSVTGGGGTGGKVTALVTGALNGIAISVYAGRVWIASGRTVSFTDVSAYNTFGGAGGAFTIIDSTLHNNITALFTANNFLYIFGDESIDVLSNVAVTSGVTSFSRVNISASIGTTLPTSIFSYYRSIMFANANGFYALNGASVEKISSKLDNLTSNISFNLGITGGNVSINNIICAAFMFTFNDTFTSAQTTRPMMAVFFQNRWFFASQGGTLKFITSVPVGGVLTLFGTDGTNIINLFSTGLASPVTIKTKLWDGGRPILDKQVIQAGVGAFYNSNKLVSVTTDNEFSTQPLKNIGNVMPVAWINSNNQIVQWSNNISQIVTWLATNIYALSSSTSTTAGGKYFGMTLISTGALINLNQLAIEYRVSRRW